MEPVVQEASNLTLAGGLFLGSMALLTLGLRREWAMVPLLATVCYMPLGQQLVLGGLHFPILRLLIVVGVVRVVCRGDARGVSLTRIDKLLLWWAVLSLVLGYLSEPSSKVLVNRLGVFYNSIGIFALACCWVRDAKTFLGAVRCLALMVVPIAVLMLIEKTTSRNVFSVFGGVSEFTAQRAGHLRCQAAFQHPILAGTFGATSLPLFLGLWFLEPKSRKLALLGVVSACTIAIAASSGGAFLAMLLGLVGFGCWRLRYQMRLVRRGIVIMILALAVVMQAPVWYLTARLSGVVGGTGWYRSWLVETTLNHFGDWWLCGTNYTAHWGPTAVLEDDPNNIDLTSQYVVEAVKGGVLKLLLFLAIIVQCFKVLGRRIHHEPVQSLRTTGFLWWTMGVCLFTHCVSFWSIPYFDQMAVLWFWLLAAISRIASEEFLPPAAEVLRPGPKALETASVDSQLVLSSRVPEAASE